MTEDGIFVSFHLFILEILDIDDCNPDPCQNNGTCTDLVNDYQCDCVSGFNGTNCDNSKQSYKCILLCFMQKKL